MNASSPASFASRSFHDGDHLEVFRRYATTPISLTLIGAAVSVGIGLMFGVLPARRAARLEPIESLRYE